jgi:hypothetical protein
MVIPTITLHYAPRVSMHRYATALTKENVGALAFVGVFDLLTSAPSLSLEVAVPAQG